MEAPGLFFPPVGGTLCGSRLSLVQLSLLVGASPVLCDNHVVDVRAFIPRESGGCMESLDEEVTSSSGDVNVVPLLRLGARVSEEILMVSVSSSIGRCWLLLRRGWLA